MAVVEELVYQISVNAKQAKKALDDFNKGWEELISISKKAVTSITVATTALTAFTKITSNANLEDIKLADSLGATVNEFLNLKNAFDLVDGSGGAFSSTITDLTKRLGSFENARDFLLGLSDELDKIEAPDLQRQFIEASLGSDDLLFSLKQGRGVLEENLKLAKKLGNTQSEATKRLTLEVNKQFTVFKNIVGSLSGGIFDATADDFVSVFKGINDTFNDYKDEIIEGVTLISKTTLKAFNFIINIGRRLVNLFDNIVGAFGGLENVGAAALAVFAALSASLVKTIAIFALLFLVVEDLFSSLSGKEGVFADIFGADNLKKFSEGLKFIGSQLKELFDTLFNVGVLDTLKLALFKLVRLVLTAIQTALGSISDVLRVQAIDNAVVELLAAERAITDASKNTNNNINNTTNNTFNVANAEQASRIASQNSAGTRLQSTVGLTP